ncbi:MAG TPA: hypothetical protein VF246_06085 [Acidimicrobiia bacterium]
MIPMVLVMALALLTPGLLVGDLSGILERGGEASYGAEQVVSCLTPDGVTSAILTIEQSGGNMVVGSDLLGVTSFATGPGDLTMMHRDGSVEHATVIGREAPQTVPYEVVELGGLTFLGREATAYRLERAGLVRAELVLDDVTGVVVRSTTYGADGALYCIHRFISFDPGSRELPQVTKEEGPTLEPLEEASGIFPEQIAGFVRLDEYEDPGGLRFTYYSDGFFSFAVFQTPAMVPLPDAVLVSRNRGDYQRAFTAGQVFYTWEIERGGMALVGDLPPDMHDAVLDDLPEPERPGWFRRLWRSIFGATSSRGFK